MRTIIRRKHSKLSPDVARFTTKLEVGNETVKADLTVYGDVRAQSIILPIYDIDIERDSVKYFDELVSFLRRLRDKLAHDRSEAAQKSLEACRSDLGLASNFRERFKKGSHDKERNKSSPEDLRKLFDHQQQELNQQGRDFVTKMKQTYNFNHVFNNYTQVGEQRISFMGSDTANVSRLFPTSQWPLPSDARLKSDVTPLGGALGRLRKLSGVTFRWNDLGLHHLTRDAAAGVSAGPGATEEQNRAVRDIVRRRRQAELAGTSVGVLAQEVDAVLPEAVTTGEGGFKEVRYHNLIPLLVEAIKEQDRSVQQQARTVARQREEIEELRSTQHDMQAELTRLRQSIDTLTRLATPRDRAEEPDSGRVNPANTTEQGARSAGH